MSGERVEVTYRISERQGPAVWRGWLESDAHALADAREWDRAYPECAPHRVTRITATTATTITEDPINAE